MEFRFRKALDQQKAEYEAQLAEKEESLQFYRPYYDRARTAEKKLEELTWKTERLAQFAQKAADAVKEVN